MHCNLLSQRLPVKLTVWVYVSLCPFQYLLVAGHVIATSIITNTGIQDRRDIVGYTWSRSMMMIVPSALQ